MGQPELSTLLEECIIQLQAGKSLEEILAVYPEFGNELRPLLETAAGMRYNQSRIILPDESMARSRQRFVTGVTMQTGRNSVFYSLHLRLAVSLTIVILLVAGLLSTGLSSAAALPGDTLYPVKLALEQVQLNLASGLAQRIKLLENFDQVRAQEVNQLNASDRMVTVTFTGIPIQSTDGWRVSGVKLNVTKPESERLANWGDFVVQITGETEGKTVNVTDIRPRVLTFSGQIQEITSGAWTIDGVEVNLGSDTKINGSGSAGQDVDASVQRQDNGQLLALNLDVHPEKDQPVSHRSPTPQGTNQNIDGLRTPEHENTRDAHSSGEDNPRLTPHPTSERTRVSTESGEDQKTPSAVSPTSRAQTMGPTEGDNNHEQKRSPTVVPSESHGETTPVEKTPTPRPTDD